MYTRRAYDLSEFIVFYSIAYNAVYMATKVVHSFLIVFANFIKQSFNSDCALMSIFTHYCIHFLYIYTIYCMHKCTHLP